MDSESHEEPQKSKSESTSTSTESKSTSNFITNRLSVINNPLQFSILHENLHQTKDLLSHKIHEINPFNHTSKTSKTSNTSKSSEKKSSSLGANLNLLEYADESSNMSNELMISSLLKNKQTRTWIPDDEVSQCARCKIDFTTMTRKHHCRLCGKIFCFQCTPYQKIIPPTWNHDNLTTPVRLCYICSRQVEVLNSLEHLIEIFSYVTPDMDMLRRMSGVCHLWNNLSSYLMGQLRNIQYKKWDEPWTQLERNQMWVNRDYFVGHSNWTVRFLASLDYSSYHFHEYQYPKFKTTMNKIFEHEEKFSQPKTWTDFYEQFEHNKNSNNTTFNSNNTTFNSNTTFGNPSYSLDKFRKHNNNLSNRILKREKIPHFNCLHMMCTGHCNPVLSGSHGVLLLDMLSRREMCPEIMKLIMNIFCETKKEEMIYYLPFLVDKLGNFSVQSGNTIGSILIPSSFNDHEYILELFWLLKYKWHSTQIPIYQFYWAKLLDILPSERVSDINSADQLVKILCNLPSRTDLFSIKEYYRTATVKGLPLPFNRNLRVHSIRIHNIQMKKSITNPIVIPMECYDENEMNDINNPETLLFTSPDYLRSPKMISKTLMLKFENVRRDMVMLKAIRLMKYLIHTYEKIDLEIVDYNVLPIDETCGLIEIVPGCMTAYEIKEKHHSSIINYIHNHNPDKTVEYLRKRFVNSCATYCVITYLLGVGDRHLDNIMITEDGRLFHIDYGYILGHDPKPLSQPKIRITKDMTDALGGVDSADYKEFHELCKKIFQGLRPHLNLFISLMSILAKTDDERKKIGNLLSSRFMQNETQKTAIIQLYSEISRSSQSSFGETMSDFFHYHTKEETMKRALTSTQNATMAAFNATATATAKVGSFLTSWVKSATPNPKNTKQTNNNKKHNQLSAPTK